MHLVLSFQEEKKLSNLKNGCKRNIIVFKSNLLTDYAIQTVFHYPIIVPI